MKDLCICLKSHLIIIGNTLLLLVVAYIPLQIDKASDYANILTAIATLLMAIYAIFLFWPNFIKRKRAENLSVSAKEALAILTETEAEIKKLFLLKDETIKSFYNDYAKAHIEVQFKLSFLLNQLRNALLLLRSKVDLVKNEKMPNFVELVTNLEQVLSQRPKSYPASFITIDFLSECGLLSTSEDSLGFGKFEDLREELLSIYELADNEQFKF